jgi:hypothetical protein
MPEENKALYEVRLEAVGIDARTAIAQALRLLAIMMTDLSENGHDCGSTIGNASGKLTKIQ